jgi:hypothetical protein
MKTRLRILKYPWHTAHDYELAKLPHDFYYLSNTSRDWSHKTRPVPSNISWIPSIESVKADVMILHVDQWLWFDPAKRLLFERLREFTGPKIIINHGCNMLDGCTSEQMQQMVGDDMMVCNSITAHRLWNVKNSRYIRHGMSPEEWPQTNHARQNLVVSQAYSNRHAACRNPDWVRALEKTTKVVWVGRDVHFPDFERYRLFLRNSSIFFNPSFSSANPRARTEAMLMGLVVVTTNMHGEEEYIQNGVNGFCSNDFNEIVDFISFLKKNPWQVEKIGSAGRQTAQSYFHIDQFLAQWEQLLSDYL